MSAAWVVAVLAFACFLCAAFSVRSGRVQLGWLGMALLAGYVVLSTVPPSLT